MNENAPLEQRIDSLQSHTLNFSTAQFAAYTINGVIRSYRMDRHNSLWFYSQLQLLCSATVGALTRWAVDSYVQFMQQNFFIIGVLVDFIAFL